MTTKVLDSKIIEIGGYLSEVVLQEHTYGYNNHNKRLVIHGHLLRTKEQITDRLSLIEERLSKLESKK